MDFTRNGQHLQEEAFDHYMIITLAQLAEMGYNVGNYILIASPAPICAGRRKEGRDELQ